VWLWLAAGLVLGGDPQAPQAPAAPSNAFAPTLPAAVGDVSAWEIVTGEFETTGERGSYAFYISPTHRALYRLMRYRIELREPVGPEERRRGRAERVAYVPRPGVREPMLCWERLAGVETSWRVVAPDTPAYALEMRVLIRVLAVHGALRRSTTAQ
jgi:hypothetical protein